MSQLLRLRGYQQEALDAIDESLQTHTRVAAVVPTGGGKTVIFAHLIEREHRKGRKALVLVHREELAEQAKTKLHSVAPDLSIGIVKAERNEVDADVIIASVQTLVRPERRDSIKAAGEIGIVIVDECHHAVARTWMEVLTDFGCFPEPDTGALLTVPEYVGTPAVGFTATLSRNDGKGLGDVWETVAFERDINWMIDHGYLTDVRGQAVTVDGLDLATIARSKGDYQEGELGNALIESGAAEVVAQAYLEHARQPDNKWDLPGVRQGVLFAPTVASAQEFSYALTRAGIASAVIHGGMPGEDRALIYKHYEAGDIRVLTTCMVLTEGWDAPWCEVAVIARPTQSAALYTQMVGRVLRPWPGKDDALVLDVVGIAGRHKLQSLTDLVKTAVQEGESYAEARDRIEKENAERIGEIAKVSGLVKSQQVELFANSHSTWLMTKGGKWFIPVTHGLFFLWPALEEDRPGTWRLGYVRAARGPRPGVNNARQPGWIESNMTLEYAMAWGEQLSELDDPTVSLKDRAWRRTKPSEGQLAMAKRLNVAPMEELLAMRKGAVSDLISIALASKQIDR